MHIYLQKILVEIMDIILWFGRFWSEDCLELNFLATYVWNSQQQYWKYFSKSVSWNYDAFW